MGDPMRILRNICLFGTLQAHRAATSRTGQIKTRKVQLLTKFVPRTTAIAFYQKQYSASGGVLFIPYKTLYIRLNIYCACASNYIHGDFKDIRQCFSNSTLHLLSPDFGEQLPYSHAWGETDSKPKADQQIDHLLQSRMKIIPFGKKPDHPDDPGMH